MVCAILVLTITQPVCVSCIKDSYFTVDYYSNKEDVKYILIIGGIIFAVYSIFFYFSEYPIEHINLLWSLIIGIAAGSGYYLIKNVSLYSEANKIPFIGFKLTLIIIGLTFILGIPLFYFIYKVFPSTKNSLQKVYIY